jgi:hypothetical protein
MATTPTPTPDTPPNFYSQAAKMSGGGAPASKPAPEDSKNFLDATAKLLPIFDKLAKLKPNGKDISKYIKAASLAIQKAKEFALDGDNGDSSSGTPADASGDATPSAGAQTPPDTGATGATS